MGENPAKKATTQCNLFCLRDCDPELTKARLSKQNNEEEKPEKLSLKKVMM